MPIEHVSEIKKALGASRVVPVPVPNPHGPLGLEHLGKTVMQLLAKNGQFATLESNRTAG